MKCNLQTAAKSSLWLQQGLDIHPFSKRKEQTHLYYKRRRVCPSPEGLLGQLDDIGCGLDVYVVVVQGGWVCGGASLSQ